jgi:Uma2 family endonuclease
MSVTFPPVQTRRWSRVEYEKLIDERFFGPDERLELLDGLLVVKEPQGIYHATAVALVHEVLRRAFGRRYHVRAQLPVALDDASEPEPDLSVVPGRPRDYLRSGHPSAPVLLVEVAESSLRMDRRHKSSLYARAGRQEYWVLNLVDRVLEVYREPVRSASAPYGFKYQSVRLLKSGATVSPLAAPRARVRVADLLP